MDLDGSIRQSSAKGSAIGDDAGLVASAGCAWFLVSDRAG